MYILTVKDDINRNGMSVDEFYHLEDALAAFQRAKQDFLDESESCGVIECLKITEDSPVSYSASDGEDWTEISIVRTLEV